MESLPGPSGRTIKSLDCARPLILLHPTSSCGRPTRHVCRADPALMEQVIMGGAVVSAVGAALVSGLRDEPEVCAACAGSGGILCFACSGSGRMEGVTLAELQSNSKRRDPLGRNVDKRECVACKGCGKLLCKNCSGSGYH